MPILITRFRFFYVKLIRAKFMHFGIPKQLFQFIQNTNF